MSVQTYSRVRCVIKSVYENLLEVNLQKWGTFPHSRTQKKVLGIPSHVYVGGVPPPNPPLVLRPIDRRTQCGNFPTCRSCEGNTNLTTSYMWIMGTIKEKLQAKRFRARALAGKCSCKTCYNSIFNNYIAKTSDINIIYDFVLAEKMGPAKIL